MEHWYCTHNTFDRWPIHLLLRTVVGAVWAATVVELLLPVIVTEVLAELDWDLDFDCCAITGADTVTAVLVVGVLMTERSWLMVLSWHLGCRSSDTYLRQIEQYTWYAALCSAAFTVDVVDVWLFGQFSTWCCEVPCILLKGCLGAFRPCPWIFRNMWILNPALNL